MNEKFISQQAPVLMNQCPEEASKLQEAQDLQKDHTNEHEEGIVVGQPIGFADQI